MTLLTGGRNKVLKYSGRQLFDKEADYLCVAGPARLETCFGD